MLYKHAVARHGKRRGNFSTEPDQAKKPKKEDLL